MRNVYPAIMYEDPLGYYVDIPDFEIGTQGEDLADAMYMARDAMGIVGIELEDRGEKLPLPNSKKPELEEGGQIVLVDVDFERYRRENDNRAMRKNCTVPRWLCMKADEANLNYSKILQKALKQELEA